MVEILAQNEIRIFMAFVMHSGALGCTTDRFQTDHEKLMHIKQKGDENPSLKKSAVALLELSWEWNSGKPFYLNFRSEWWCLLEGTTTGCWNNIVTYFYPLKSNLLLSHDSNRNFIHASLQLVFQTVQFFILLDWEFTDRYVNVP